MRIPDAQIDLFESSAWPSIGVGRRDFLKVLGAHGRGGRPRLRDQAQAARPSKPGARREARQGAGVPLRRRRLVPERPVQPRLQQGPVLLAACRALFAGLMVFNADFVAVPWMAAKVEANKDGLGVDVHHPEGLQVVGRLAAARARDFEWSWKRQLDPASAAPYASFFYDIKNARGLQQEADRRTPRRSASGPRTTGRWRSRSRGRAATSPCSPPTWPRCPRTGPSVEKHGDKWTEAANIVMQRPVHAGGVGAQQADRAQEEPALLRGQGRAPDPGGRSRSSRWRAAPCPTRATSST